MHGTRRAARCHRKQTQPNINSAAVDTGQPCLLGNHCDGLLALICVHWLPKLLHLTFTRVGHTFISPSVATNCTSSALTDSRSRPCEADRAALLAFIFSFLRRFFSPGSSLPLLAPRTAPPRRVLGGLAEVPMRKQYCLASGRSCQQHSMCC